MAFGEGYMDDIIAEYPLHTQIVMKWGRYIAAQLYKNALKDEDYEICGIMKQAFAAHNFNEKFSFEMMKEDFQLQKLNINNLREEDFEQDILEAKLYLKVSIKKGNKLLP